MGKEVLLVREVPARVLPYVQKCLSPLHEVPKHS